MSHHSSQSPGFDPANPAHRLAVVEEVHRLMEQAYPGDWNDRCPDVATHVMYVLKAYGISGYQIAAGELKEASGNPPAVLFKGEYTGTGKSQYHTWVVGPSGETLDFSVVPTRYGKQYVWEPYETLPALIYREIPDTTCAVLKDALKKYRAPADTPLASKDDPERDAGRP